MFSYKIRNGSFMNILETMVVDICQFMFSLLRPERRKRNNKNIPITQRHDNTKYANFNRRGEENYIFEVCVSAGKNLSCPRPLFVRNGRNHPQYVTGLGFQAIDRLLLHISDFN